MTTALLREALADHTVTERAAERARVASSTAAARSTVTIREFEDRIEKMTRLSDKRPRSD